MQLDKEDDALIQTLESLLPSEVLKPIFTESSRQAEASLRLELPVPEEADYCFVLYLRPEPQIHAIFAKDHSAYFWYMPFEEAAFAGSPPNLRASFISTIELVIRNETRIVQKRHLASTSFQCDVKADAVWAKVYGHSCSKFGNFKPPQIAGKEHVYTSPPIV